MATDRAEPRTRPAVAFIRCRPEWKEAAERLAEHDHAPSLADVIDRAVASYARQVGFPEPIPKR